jgi:signal transduction histidine kinase
MIRQRFQQQKANLIDIALVVLLLPPTFVWATRHHSFGLAVAPVLAVVLPASIATQFVVGVMPPFALGLALYTVASHTERRVALRAGVVTLVTLVALLLVRNGLDAKESVMHLIIFAAATWILGDNVRTKRAYYRELEERAERLEREREENIRRATAEEQERIARELHDVIAHSVSVMVVQAPERNRAHP